MVEAQMQFLGEHAGVKWYWAAPERFEKPGVYYWDGKNNVHVSHDATFFGIAQRPAPVAPVGVDAPIDANDSADYIEHCAARLESFGHRVTAGALRVIAAEHRALAQQQGQAVACVQLNPMRGKDDPRKIAYLDADLPVGTKLYAAPPSAPVEKFTVKHYTEDEGPTIKGNGFDGLRVGEDREDAEEFVRWLNRTLAQQPAAIRAWVGDMKTSAGMDYYVCVGRSQKHGEYLTPNMYKIRGRAEYDVAEWNHLLGHGPEPDILSFDTETPDQQPAAVDDTVHIGAVVCFGDDYFRQIHVEGVMFLVPVEQQDNGRFILSAKKRRAQPAAVGGAAEFEVHAGGEYFATVGGPRERAWRDALHYIATLHPSDGEPEVFEVTRRKVPLAVQQQETTT